MRVSVLRTGTFFGYSSTQKTLLTRSVYRVLVVISTSTKRDMLSERERVKHCYQGGRGIWKSLFSSLQPRPRGWRGYWVGSRRHPPCLIELQHAQHTQNTAQHPLSMEQPRMLAASSHSFGTTPPTLHTFGTTPFKCGCGEDHASC